MRIIKAADLFCGAGGASTGLVRACQALGVDLELLAINHWPIAVETHSANHPKVRHLCESVERVDPRVAVPGGRLHLLMAGPECTHFSTARGGRPVNPQSRASAWHILKWAQELYIDTILIENVPEFGHGARSGRTASRCSPRRARRTGRS
jgi:DNA (cytosine-5)-methyltransferase 1